MCGGGELGIVSDLEPVSLAVGDSRGQSSAAGRDSQSVLLSGSSLEVPRAPEGCVVAVVRPGGMLDGRLGGE